MIELDGRAIGLGHEPYIIAEAGVNIRGDMELSKSFIDAAAEGGADAIKFQTHLSHAEMVQDEMDALGLGDLFERMSEYEFSLEEHRELKAHCLNNDIDFLSTPFSVEAVDLLAELDVPAIKIGSGELDNFHLLKRAAETDKPLLVSTGMSDWQTVEDAVTFLRKHTDEFALLYCVSEYPTESDNFDFGLIDQMKSEFDVSVGFSDHSTGIEAAAIAIARGADFVEKHFTIDKRLPGGDQNVSIEPEELRQLTEFARISYGTRGQEKTISDEEASIKKWTSHSIVTTENIESGEVLTENNMTTKRPGIGISAQRYFELLGAEVVAALDSNEIIHERHLSES